MAEQNFTTPSPTNGASEFYCPENFFIVNPDAPALQNGVLGIQLERIDCLVELARETESKIDSYVLLETVQIMIKQLRELVSHDEAVRKQAQAAAGGAA